jgi:uncharacterized membrane protein
VAERDFSPGRLEAISDGVIAVAITIMVLALTPPREPTPAALLVLWPQFLGYVVSFFFVATYWVNHRYLFRHLRLVDETVLWTNMALLFLISLIPFSTAYAGSSGLAPFPMAVYAAVMLANALAFTGLALAIRRQHDPSERPAGFRGTARIINLGGLVAYAAAIPLAFALPTLSLALIFAVCLIYMTPLPRPEA